MIAGSNLRDISQITHSCSKTVLKIVPDTFLLCHGNGKNSGKS
jgi:hypothetical protein